MLTHVNPQSLRPGARLSHDLYSRQGAKLLPAGTILTPSICAALRAYRGDVLFLAKDAHELAARRMLTPTMQAPVGERARADVATIGGVIPVSVGERVEPHHADAYALGAYVAGTPIEPTFERRTRLRIAEQLVAERAERWRALPLRVERGADPFVAVEALDDPRADEPAITDNAILRWRDERVERHRWTFARITAGARVDIDDSIRLVHELMDALVHRPHRFALLAAPAQRRTDYLPDHAFTACALSVAIAARLGLSAADVRIAGLAGLFADCGMSFVPEHIRNAERELDDIEINRVRRHPALSVALLDVVRAVPGPVLQAVYQHHERDDGSGYPNALRARAISDYARIIAVADAFAGASSPRPYRLTYKRPYDAMAEIVRLAGAGAFDRTAVRALVETVGLFPVGSHVRLSTGERAVVVRANPHAVNRPVVRVLRADSLDGYFDRGAPQARSEPIDLAEVKPLDVRIVRAIDPPERYERGALAA